MHIAQISTPANMIRGSNVGTVLTPLNNVSSSKTVSRKLRPGGPRSVQVSMNLIGPSRTNMQVPNSPALCGESLLDSRETFDSGSAAIKSEEENSLSGDYMLKLHPREI